LLPEHPERAIARIIIKINMICFMRPRCR
jgi:hypothetical protein